MGAAEAGKLAALAAALAWAVTVTAFTFAARKAGAQVVNAARLCLALVLTMGLHLLLLGSPWPRALGLERCLWLLLSGFVGFALSDGFGLESFLRIGPRLGMLVQTLSPVFSLLLAWIFLGQRLSWAKGGAIGLTLAGLLLVVAQGPQGEHASGRRAWALGLLLALGAALGQALGQVTAVKGMAGELPLLSASLVRLLGGAAGILAWLALRGGASLSAIWARPSTLGQFLLGTALGPVGGVLLSLYAMTHVDMGVASTLMYMVPVFMLPIGRIFFQERLGVRALLGTALTVAGTVALFFVP